MPDFSSALNVNAAEVEAPPLPPAAHFRWKVMKRQFGEVGDGRFDTVDFMLQGLELIIAEDEDVDPDVLAQIEACGGVTSINLRHRFMFDKGEDGEAKAKFDRSLFYMKRFLVEHLGQDEHLTIKELVDGAINCTCIADIRHRQDPNDAEVFYAEIGRTAPDA